MPKSFVAGAELSPIEEYFYLVDRPQHPKTILVRMQFSGVLDRAAFTQSVDAAIGRRPILTATVTENRGLRWNDRPDWRPEIVWDCELLSNGLPDSEYVSIRDAPGTRIWVSTATEQHWVFLQVHHCCADGIGLVRFTEELLAHYARFETLGSDGDETPTNTKREPKQREPKQGELKQRALEQKTFLNRSSPEVTAWQYQLSFWRHPRYVRDCIRMFFRHPVALRQQTVSTAPGSPCAAECLSHTFNAKESERILAWCRSQNVTVNTLLLQKLFFSIENWRTQTDLGKGNERLRICMPVNLRTNHTESMTIANCISFMLIDHQTGQTSPSSSLKAIQAQVHSPYRVLRLTFNVLMRFGRCFPGGVRRFLGSQNCWATAIFSNLGRVLGDWPAKTDDGRAVAGNLTLDDWQLLPPLHDNVGLTVCSSSYAGRLKVLFYHDPNLLPKNEARELWELFLTTLRTTADLNSRGPHHQRERPVSTRRAVGRNL